MSDEVPTPRSLTEDLKDEIRGSFAALRKSLEGFRPRKSQNRMIGFASTVLAQDGGVGACEAPTGVGKSLGYLTAGVPIALAHKKKLVLATGTVALQEQLLDQDLPLFNKATCYDAKVVLAKGRGRYACPRNIADLAGGQDAGGLFEGDDAMQDSASSWTFKPGPTETGLVERLFRGLESGKWDGDLDRPPEAIPDRMRPLLTTTRGGCSGRRCAYIEQCPFFLARKEIEHASIIVANHSLVLADLSMPAEDGSYGGVVLPPPSDCLYVFDEGHHLAERARDVGSAQYVMPSFGKRAQKLRSYIRASYQALDKEKIGKLSSNEGFSLMTELQEALASMESEIGAQWTPQADSKEEPMWVAPNGVIPAEWQMRASELARLSKKVESWLGSIRRGLLDASDLPKGAQETLPRELGAAIERVTGQRELWELWDRVDSPNAIPIARWITLDPKDSSLILHASSVSAAQFLEERLFNQAGAVLLTSATLGDMEALKRNTGMPKDAETVSLPSPFNLPENGTLRVPAMRTLPADREGHATEVAQWLDQNLDWEAGNLVIFTSRAKMKMVHERLSPEHQLRCKVQGSQAKSTLLKQHASDVEEGFGSTLFGLASFGEGLSLPGKLCTTVVVTQLPFAVPTDPVLSTYSQWLESKGRRPFDEISVPDATRVLIQYLGRLLRHEDDRGEVVILDRRLVDKRYGRTILEALPPFKRAIERT